MKKLVFLLALFLFPSPVLASDHGSSQFITIVNPVRISRYTVNPAESVQAQYSVVASKDFPATWLFTYDALAHDGVISVAKTMDEKQEFGLFLEVTPAFAEAAGVEYHITGSWHHANSVFLSGYTQDERVKLIETLFGKFKERFGYYPSSVGSWWSDGFSLSYMKEKYGVTANLGVTDQFSTDGYQVWGQYWSVPFYPSRYHPAIPAPSEEVKLDLVTIQWAPRDPYNGYYSSLFSTQDYQVSPVNQGTDYFEKLVNLYARKHNNLFGQITIGLEADLTADVYQGQFAEQMDVAKKFAESGEFDVTNMKDFSQWYRSSFPGFSPVHIIESDDLLGKDAKSVWYQSPRYRIGLFQTASNGQTETRIVDFRTYHPDLQEPYYEVPNRENDLSIYVPSIFDEISSKIDIWKFGFGEIVSIDGGAEKLVVDFGFADGLVFTPEKIVVSSQDLVLPEIIQKHEGIRVSRVGDSWEISPKEAWIAPREGVLLQALTPEATHFLGQKRVTLAGLLAASVLLGVYFLISRLRLHPNIKIILQLLIVLPVIVLPSLWYEKNTTTYFISQGEADALFRLSVMPKGKVLVYNQECLQCSYHTTYKPAVFANKRRYVQERGKHPLVANQKVFTAETRQEAKDEFKKTGASYIYLAKYEDYIEKVPFSPGDLGIEKIYDNANAEIWKIKE